MKRITLLCGIFGVIMLLPAPVQADFFLGGELQVAHPPLFGNPGFCHDGRFLSVALLCTSFCGHEFELACLAGCLGGRVLDVNLVCRNPANVGGNGQLALAGFLCDFGNTIIPFTSTCTACGGEGLFPCIINPIGCVGGRVLGVDLRCYLPANLGGDGELAFPGFVCNAGNTIIPFTSTCTACGGDDELLCANAINGPIGCDAGHTLNPLNPLFCTECGGTSATGEDQFICLNFQDPICDSEHTLNIDVFVDPTNFLGKCTQCGGEGEFLCANLAFPVELGCDPGFGADALAIPPFLKCTLCGGNNKPLCAGEAPCLPGHRVATFPLGVLLCEDSGFSAEPTTNSSGTVPLQNIEEPLFGWADTHEHHFANLAFGGAQLWGSPFDEQGRGVNGALAWCDFTFDFPVQTPSLGLSPSPSVRLPIHFSWGYPIHGNSFFSSVFPFVPTQGIYGFLHGMATQQSPFPPHLPGGTGPFDGWPNFKTGGGHQQMYYKWLERAYEGGMRLMVNLMVENEVLCKLSFQRDGVGRLGRDFDLCNDMLSVERQIQATKDLEAFIDAECGSPGCGWYRIAKSPQEARQIISDGKMAVILGIEVDTLFDCRPATSPFNEVNCTEAHIQAELDRFHALGVRYILPVHFFDTSFGGGAIDVAVFAYANFYATGQHLETWDCSEFGFTFKVPVLDLPNLPGFQEIIDQLAQLNPAPLIQFVEALAAAIAEKDFIGILYAAVAAVFGEDVVFDQTQGAHCNALGLEPAGEILLRLLIEKDMFIDIDHMSFRALEGYQDDAGVERIGALEIFDDPNGERGYKYPVISGHGSILEDYNPVNDNKIISEGGHTESRVRLIRELGGIVAVNVPRGGKCHDTREFVMGVPRHVDEDLNLVLAERKGYNGILDIMDGDNEYECDDGSECDPSDPDACLDCAPVVPFYGEGHPGIALTTDFGSFLPQPAPRFSNDKVCSVDGNPCTFNGDCPPGQSCVVDLAKECDGCGPGTDCSPYDPTRPLEYPFRAFDGSGMEFAEQVTGQRIFDFNTEGLAHIGLWPDLLADVRTFSGGSVPCTQDAPDCDSFGELCGDDGFCIGTVDLDPIFNSAETFIRMWERIENCTPDLGPPTITCPPDKTLACDASTDPSNTGTAVASDACDTHGDTPVVSYIDSGAGGCQTFTRTWVASDAVGNVSQCTQTIIVEDAVGPTDPVLTVPSDVTIECDESDDPSNTGQATATDNCDADPPVTFSDTSLGTCPTVITRTWTATDNCGNFSESAQTITVQDTTNPVLSGVPADVTVECDSVPAPATPTATDNCDGDVAIAFVEVRTDGNCEDNYTLTRTWTATDNCGNVSVSAQTITVQDTTDPVLSGVPADVTVECDAVPLPASPTAADNCDPNPSVAFVEVRTDGVCPDSYTLTRTWTATDDCSNSSDETQTITVQDTTDAVFDTFPADTTLECPADTSVAANGSPTGSDNCGDVTITNSDSSTPGCGDTEVITRTWEIEDACGNSTSEPQIITVQDTAVPTITCPENITETPTSPEGVEVAYAPTVSDDCDSTPTVSCTPTSGSLFAIGMTTVVDCTVTDACENSADCSFEVTVLTAVETAQGIIDLVQELVDSGTLNQGQGNSLITKIEGVIAKIEQGQTTPACNKLNAFINQVSGFNGGVLEAGEGQPLIDAAENLRSVIPC